MRRFRFCQHTKDNGESCGSPAMRKQRYCYFHLEVVRRRRRLALFARRRELLAEAKHFDDRILAVKSCDMKILTPYSRTNFTPSRICMEEGGGGGTAAEWTGCGRDANAPRDRQLDLAGLRQAFSDLKLHCHEDSN